MKLPNIFKRKRSIARRLTWRVILTVTLVFAIISTFIFGIIWVVGSALLVAFTNKDMDVANEKISNVFTNIEVAVANNKAVVEENIGDGAKLYDAQKHLLSLNPNILGAAVAYNPDSKRMRGRKSAAFAYRDGRDSASISTKQLNNKKYNYLNKEWFIKAREEGEGSWSEPYLDAGGSNIPTITYSLPLVDKNNEVYAIMTAGAEQTVRSTADAGRILCAMFRHEQSESVRLLCLNAGGKVLKLSRLNEGDDGGCRQISTVGTGKIACEHTDAAQ